MNRTFLGIAHQSPFSRSVMIIDENRSTVELHPDRSQAVKNHSPDGFNWGYAGSGPAQLALAILLEVTNDETIALAHYHNFEREVIAAIQSQETNWEIKENKIIAWLEAQQSHHIEE